MANYRLSIICMIKVLVFFWCINSPPLPLYLPTPKKKKKQNMQNRQISKNCSILREKAFLDEIGCADENVRN